ncbi:hypothetical protein D3C75_412770 [compost metagenome]
MPITLAMIRKPLAIASIIGINWFEVSASFKVSITGLKAPIAFSPIFPSAASVLSFSLFQSAISPGCAAAFTAFSPKDFTALNGFTTSTVLRNFIILESGVGGDGGTGGSFFRLILGLGTGSALTSGFFSSSFFFSFAFSPFHHSTFFASSSSALPFCTLGELFNVRSANCCDCPACWLCSITISLETMTLGGSLLKPSSSVSLISCKDWFTRFRERLISSLDRLTTTCTPLTNRLTISRLLFTRTHCLLTLFQIPRDFIGSITALDASIFILSPPNYLFLALLRA